MKELVFSSLKKRKVQTATVVLVIAASTALLFALLLMYTGVSKGVALSEERGGAEVMLVSDDAADSVSDSDLLFTGAPSPIYLDAAIAEKAAGIEGVKSVSVQFFSQTLSASCCDTGSETRVVGFDPETDWVVQPLTDYDLSRGLADDQVLLGSRFSSDRSDEFVILGKVYRVAGYLAATGSDIDQCIMMDIGAAREMSRGLAGYGHYWEKYGDPSGLVSDVLVDLDDDLTDSERTMVLRRLDNLDDTRAIERSGVIDTAQQQLASVFGVMLVAGVAMLVVCILQLFARFYSMAWDRKSELALYRAVGATRSQVARLIGMEAALLSAVGVAAGLAAGFVLYGVAQAWLSSLEAFPFVAVSPGLAVLYLVAIVAFFAGVTLLSVLAPLRQIGRIDPSLAMQQSDID